MVGYCNSHYNLQGNHFYFALLGELYAGIGSAKAKPCFKQALSLAKTIADKQAMD